MSNIARTFKDEIDKAYTTQPNVKLNTDTIGDANRYKNSFVESFDEDEDLKPKKKNKHMVAKDKFNKDLQDDPDFIEFKKNSKYDDDGQTRSFGVPRASGNDPFVKKKKYGRVKNSETKEATGSGSVGAYSAPVFGGDDEFWERSRKETPKLEESEVEKVEATEATGSGSVGAYSAPVFGGDDEFWERSRKETPKLEESEVEKVEATEATGSGSVGAYSTPSMWAKSTSKKDWGPSRKTQIPGGGFVKIKKKCTKFPYCNQGDINNLKISKNESVKDAVREVSKKLGISESVIITILEHEYQNVNKRTK
jgi:hypothetical protein